MSKDFNKRYNLNVKDLTLLKKTSLDEFITSKIVGKPTTRAKDVWKRFFRNPWTIVALIIALIIVFLTLLAPLVSPHSGTEPISPALSEYVRELPSSLSGLQTTYKTEEFLVAIQSIEKQSEIKVIYENVFLKDTGYYKLVLDPYALLQGLSSTKERLFSIIGTDSYGRDIWTRVWIGTRNALGLSLFVLIIQTIIGVGLGSYLGFNIGKRVDTIMMRFVEIFNSIPVILWIIILIGLFGTSFWAIAFTLTFIGILGPVYTVRMFMISIKDQEFLSASRALGSSWARVIYIEALPLIIGKLSSNFVSNLMTGVFSLSSLAFLGFIEDGLNSSPNLGLSLYSSRNLADVNPMAVAFPVIMLLTSIASLKVISIGIHDALDPKAGKGV